MRGDSKKDPPPATIPAARASGSLPAPDFLLFLDDMFGSVARYAQQEARAGEVKKPEQIAVMATSSAKLN